MTEKIWQASPELIQNSNLVRFWKSLSPKNELNSFSDVHQWSITHREEFWEHIWKFFEIRFSKKWHSVVEEPTGMFKAKWFSGCEMNFSENILRYQDDNIAIEFINELGLCQKISFSSLYKQVAVFADALRNADVKKGDRVAAVMPNIPDAVIAMLACNSIGAIWSCCSPDFGGASLLDRFEQINPTVLLYCDSYYYKGTQYNIENKVESLILKLNCSLVILIPYPDKKSHVIKVNSKTISKDKFIQDSISSSTISFEQLDFNFPLYILYSSGTTGVPKCIVHGAGGTLLQHLKELGLHTNLSRKDKLFYYTTTGWMMWNWQLSALALGSTIVLYDGSPFFPTSDILLKKVYQHDVDVFGCSAKYINTLNKLLIIYKNKLETSKLRTILSTGSPLLTDDFYYIHECIKKDIQISSISGGTDIVSCFALGNSISSVYCGELQGLGLAMDVRIFDDNGLSVTNQKGELVCVSSFPSMPVYFWNDFDDKKYFQAYFSHFPGVWTHGDYAEIIEHTGQSGMVIYGRSDSTLNPGGIRIGTAEIYRHIGSLSFIEEGIVISQSWMNQQRIILFVILKDNITLDQVKIDKVKKHIREKTSVHHVPDMIIQIHDIPKTYNGKISELAVSDTIHERPVKNLTALINPDSLIEFKKITQEKLL